MTNKRPSIVMEEVTDAAEKDPVMSDDRNRKKTAKPARPQPQSTPADDECEVNTGRPSKGPRKPECPEGYPNEQPKGKPDPKQSTPRSS